MENNILENLKEKYVGQVYEKGYGAWTEIGQYVCERLEHEYKVPFTYSSIGHKNKDMIIRYKGWGVFRIIFRKKKGQQMHNLFRGYYFTWTIKDIEIQKCTGYGNFSDDSTIEDYIREINVIDEIETMKQNQEDQKLIEAFNLLKDHFKLKTNTEVRNLVRRIDNTYYRLFYGRDEEND